MAFIDILLTFDFKEFKQLLFNFLLLFAVNSNC